MFKIYDGRDRFYQWDVDRKLIIEDATITQVHFCNRTDECSLVCETYQENGLTLVNVPNILLQTDWRINVYAYDTNYTKFCETYKVERRSKPEDYVYTETEVLNFNTLLNRIDEVDANIAKSVNDYLEENPVEVDLTGYVTEEDMQAAIEAIELTPGPQGPIGETGPAGKDGRDGYTPVKGVDYFDGAPGKDGKDGTNGKDGAAGKDGYTPVKGVDYFDGEPGKDGANGKDGVDGKDYVLTEADKQEIAGMVDVSGGDGGGGTAYILECSGSSGTAETIAILQAYYDYYVANGAVNPNVTLIAHTSSIASMYMKITDVQIISGLMKFCSPLTEMGYKGVGYASISNGKVTNCNFNVQYVAEKGWHWASYYDSSMTWMADYSHVKLVFCLSDDPNTVLTFDVSTSSGNTFNDEYGSKYTSLYPDVYGGMTQASFYNYGGSIDTSLEGYTFLGYYYWG